MKITICQIDANNIREEWSKLEDYLSNSPTDLLLLPEFPFDTWFNALPEVNDNRWDKSIESHKTWEDRLQYLNVDWIIGTSPRKIDGNKLNIGWIWTHEQGISDIHQKYYLPDEEGFWEAKWYDRGDGKFDAYDCGKFKIGLMTCTDMWFFEHARAYAEQGIDLLLVPRSTELATVDRWLVGGRTAAIVSGAYCLSSNHAGLADDKQTLLGGRGWVCDPSGEVIARTSPQTPFITVEIDLSFSEQSKFSYPRYVLT